MCTWCAWLITIVHDIYYIRFLKTRRNIYRTGRSVFLFIIFFSHRCNSSMGGLGYLGMLLVLASTTHVIVSGCFIAVSGLVQLYTHCVASILLNGYVV